MIFTVIFYYKFFRTSKSIKFKLRSETIFLFFHQAFLQTQIIKDPRSWCEKNEREPLAFCTFRQSRKRSIDSKPDNIFHFNLVSPFGRPGSWLTMIMHVDPIDNVVSCILVRNTMVLVETSTSCLLG